MSTYPVISGPDAIRYLTSRVEEDEVALEDIRQARGSGAPLNAKIFESLREDLVHLRAGFPDKLRAKDPAGGKFETEACVLVHKALSDVPKSTLADPEFWIWMATDLLADILEWRFGSPGKPAKLANYGVGSRSENMFFRLWLRAELGHTGGKDAYGLAKEGDQDLWRSHLLRQGYANARTVARALLKLQSGKLVVGGKSAQKLIAGDDPAGVRMLAKRLRRMRANVLFEFLSPQQADGLVFELSADLKKG